MAPDCRGGPPARQSAAARTAAHGAVRRGRATPRRDGAPAWHGARFPGGDGCPTAVHPQETPT